MSGNTCDGETRLIRTGESIRFRGDRPHKLLNPGTDYAHATMVLVLRQMPSESQRN